MSEKSFFERLVSLFKKVKAKPFFEYDMAKGKEFEDTGKSIENDEMARKFHSLHMDCLDRGDAAIVREDFKAAQKYGMQAEMWRLHFWYRVKEVGGLFDCRQKIIITRDWKIGLLDELDENNLSVVQEVIDSALSSHRITFPIISRN